MGALDIIKEGMKVLEKEKQRIKDEADSLERKLSAIRDRNMQIDAEQKIYEKIFAECEKDEHTRAELRSDGTIDIETAMKQDGEMSYSDLAKQVLYNHPGDRFTVREIAEKAVTGNMTSRAFDNVIGGVHLAMNACVEDGSVARERSKEDKVLRYSIPERKKEASNTPEHKKGRKGTKINKPIIEICKDVLSLSPNEKMRPYDIANFAVSTNMWRNPPKTYKSSLTIILNDGYKLAGIKREKVGCFNHFWVEK